MIEVRLEGGEDVVSKLLRIKDPSLQKRILRKVGRHVVKASKDRIGKQEDIYGIPFTPRADGSGRPLLMGGVKKPGVRKSLKVLEVGLSDLSISVGYDNSFLAMIAERQQFGFSEPTKERESKRKEVDENAPATREQASALLNIGFKVKRKGKPWLTPSRQWIVKNITTGRAGMLLRILRGSTGTKGITTIPARSFLGVSSEDLETISTTLREEITAALRGA